MRLMSHPKRLKIRPRATKDLYGAFGDDVAHASKGQTGRLGYTSGGVAASASPEGRLSGHYRVDLSDSDAHPIVHVEGALGVHLSTPEPIDDPAGDAHDRIQLRIDEGTFDALDLALEHRGDHWHLSIEPSVKSADQSDLLYRATHDELTDLANREHFVHHVEMALARTVRAEGTLGVLYLDLDGFKTVNDIYGHQAGDLVLAEVGRRLRTASRPMDLAARLGGDEFALACEGLRSPIEAGIIARRVVDALEPPMNIDGRHLAVSASVGIALSDGTTHASELVKRADAAMYKAKSDAMTRVRMHSEADQTQVNARQGRNESLRAALERSRLDVVYRSIHAIDGSGVIAIEADCDLGAPGGSSGWDDISMPRDIEDDLALHLLEQTTADLMEIRAAGLDERVPIHVRLPARLLLDSGLADMIVDLTSGFGVSPSEIALDVDEALTDMRMATPGLRRLHEAGVPLSIVGFGLNRSSLSGLATTPAQVLKIDRAFVADADTSRRGVSVLAAIIDLAHAHSMTTVALGVETPRQLDILRRLGCDAAEGSMFSGPKSKDELLFAIGAGLQVA
jgi:diguanylate cyclase (GGDEF)-like protein